MKRTQGIGYQMQAEFEQGHARQPAGLAERLFNLLLRHIRHGQLTVVLPDGREHIFRGTEAGPRAELHVIRWRFLRRVLTGGDLAFAEAYMDGDCDSPDLAALAELAGLNMQAFDRFLEGVPLVRLVKRVAARMRPNTRRGARRNIAHHYDLGNEFYAAWLDPTMTYSAAVFEGDGDGLAAAQSSKYRRIAARAGIEPGHEVLEIGCGWGGFACWAARELGCRVTAITISKAQFEFARRRVHEAGLEDRVEVRLQDYRDVDGTFDRVVSIEMFEAVGERYWPQFFATLNGRLKAGGRAALQVITIADDCFDDYRRDVDFIRQYIFPGGLLPSAAALHDQARRAGLSLADQEAFGADYARTLVHWRQRFEHAWADIVRLGFDERFRRMWRYYLAYCEAGFRIGRVDVLQLALAKG